MVFPPRLSGMCAPPPGFFVLHILAKCPMPLHLLHLSLYAGHFLGGCFLPHFLHCLWVDPPLFYGVSDLSFDFDWNLFCLAIAPTGTLPAPASSSLDIFSVFTNDSTVLANFRKS